MNDRPPTQLFDRRLGIFLITCLALATPVLSNSPAASARGEGQRRGKTDRAKLVPTRCVRAESTETSTDAARDAVAAATHTLYTDGISLLPARTTVDRAQWQGNVILVDLTVDVGTRGWRLSPLKMEAISAALARPFMDDPAFGGIAVRLRTGSDGVYHPLDDFVAYKHTAQPVEPVQVQLDEPAPAPAHDAAPVTRGSVPQVTRQPIGALTGITVFASCGHGWTAGGAPDNEWYLQRPVLWDMNEDHGNLDQLNYFVRYAFHAGATVVPFRPVGWQAVEVVRDNADPGVVFTGSWGINATDTKYYGSDPDDRFRYATTEPTETATARYQAQIPVTGFYPVFCFAIAGESRTLQTYRIKHTGGISEVTVDHRLVGNGWIWLGEYYLEAGGDNWVEITNASPQSGFVIADAIRWGCGMGDIVRPGPESVSGYSRDEECQRYWAHGVLGNNANGFVAADIWDSSSSDVNDNVTTGARWAREMNHTVHNNDRWRRVHLEFHTNAFSAAARGCLALISSDYPTTNQTAFAEIMADEVDMDMLLLQDQFEHSWYDRASPTLAGAYGAISTYANGNEFDATLIELGFHDNQQDAELLRDDRVRAAMARSCVQGIVKFLNGLSAGAVPLSFAPDVPQNVQVADAGNGNVTVSWQPPLSGEAYGDPATGYVVYASSNGHGFGNPVVLGEVLSTTIGGVPVGETIYYRIAATNAGGESMPSEVLAVRRPVEGTAGILIVIGFDSLRRQQNPTVTIPPGTIERQIWRRSNSYDYVIQYADALATVGAGFASCANEAARDGQAVLADYDVVIWTCGEEAPEDSTFDAGEQAAVEAYLTGGGALFVSGSEIANDLDNQGDAASRAFYQNILGASFAGDDADTYTIQGATGSIFEGLGQVQFDIASGAPYDADTPDKIVPRTGVGTALYYVGGSGGTAAVEYDSGTFRVVNFGFPFEAIASAADRAEVMQRIIGFLEADPVPFDWNGDGYLGLSDFGPFVFCLQQSGPDNPYFADVCRVNDSDGDGDVDLEEFAHFQRAFTGDP